MRERVLNLRSELVTTFQNQTNSNKFDYINSHKGMFSMTGLSDKQINQLREEHAIYMIQGGRINIAGLQQNKIDHIVSAILSV